MDNIDGKILMLLDSGKTLREIIDEGDFNLSAYIHMNRSKIDVMIENWTRHRLSHPTKDQTKTLLPKKKYTYRGGLDFQLR